MSKLDLPKDYLSYSSMLLWTNDKEGFRRRYYEGEPYFSTAYTDFGNKVGDALEAKELHDTPLFDPILEEVPRYSVPEYKIEVEVHGVPTLMFLDSFDPYGLGFLEYKTGIVNAKTGDPWNRVKVRKHKQLPIYALGIREKHGSYNPNTNLVWMETKWSTIDHELKLGDMVSTERRRGLKLTGKVELFPRKIEEWELDRQAEIIRNIAEEISYDHKQWKLNGQTSQN